MRTVAAIVVAAVVAAVIWFVASLGWNLLNLARGETGWLTRAFVEFITPGIGAAVGMHAAEKVVKQFSLDGLFYGLCAAAVTATAAIGFNMQAVAERAGWRPFDWLVLVVTPLGAVLGAHLARASLRETHAAAAIATKHAT